MTDFLQQFKDFFAAAADRWPQIVVGLLIFVLLTAFAGKLTGLIGKLIRRLFQKWPRVAGEIEGALRNPLRVFFVVLGVELAFLIISPETKWMTFIDKLFRMTNISLIAWVLLNYTPAATRQIIRFNQEKDNSSSEVTIRFMAIILRVVIVSLLAVILISEMGYNINGIIAGLGLSGLTLSLAAQNTASNLFSGFEITTDQPFDVGDYIATPSAEGFVEDITMRSTRIRTRDDLLVTVPNANLMKEAITNYSKMGQKAVQFDIGLTYDTTSEQLKAVCDEISEFLRKDADIADDNISVVFRDFGDSAQIVEVRYFTKTTDKYENLKVRERVNYEVRRIVEETGAHFAYPTTTVHMSQ